MDYESYIPDGQYSHGFIRGAKPAYGDLRFEYRRMPYEERQRLLQLSREDVLAYHRKCVEEVGQRISKWNSKAPTNAIGLGALHPILVQRITDVVTGLDPGDVDPDWDYSRAKMYSDECANAKRNGTSLESERETAALKN